MVYITKKQYTEEELVQGIKNDSEEVISYLYRELAPKVYHDVVKNSGTEEDAKDLFQYALLEASGNVKAGKFHSGTIMGYIRKIAHNMHHKGFRKKQKEINYAKPEKSKVEPMEDMTIENYHILLKYEQQIDILKDTLVTMNEPCKSILTQFYYYNERLDDIAGKHKWRYQYCKKKIFNCRKQLKQLVEKAVKSSV